MPPVLLTDDSGHVASVGGSGDATQTALMEGIVADDGSTVVPAAESPDGLVPVVVTDGGRFVAGRGALDDGRR